MTKQIIALVAISALTVSASAANTDGSVSAAGLKVSNQGSNFLTEKTGSISAKSMNVSETVLEFLHLDSGSANRSVELSRDASEGGLGLSEAGSNYVSDDPVIGWVTGLENSTMNGIESGADKVSALVEDSYGSAVGSIELSIESAIEIKKELGNGLSASGNMSAALAISTYQGSLVLIKAPSEASQAGDLIESGKILLSAPLASYEASRATMAAQMDKRGLK